MGGSHSSDSRGLVVGGKEGANVGCTRYGDVSAGYTKNNTTVYAGNHGSHGVSVGFEKRF